MLDSAETTTKPQHSSKKTPKPALLKSAWQAMPGQVRLNLFRAATSPLLRPRQLLAARSGNIMAPNFLILGAQKAGTTSLFNYLLQHPDMAAPLRKEIHYFDHFYGRGETWYLAHFPVKNGRANVVTGESSPFYLFSEMAAERISADLPNAKLIVILRNPIERAYSHYQHEVQYGFETASFSDAIAREQYFFNFGSWPAGVDTQFAYDHYSYVARGLYAEQLTRWFALAPRENFMVLRNEALSQQPAEVYAQMLAFLEMAPHQLPEYGRHNKGSYGQPIAPTLRAELNAFFAPSNQQLSELLNDDFSDWQ